MEEKEHREVRQQLSSVLGETAVLAAISSVALLVTFAYEAGYNGAFHMPLAYLRIDMETFLKGCFSLVLAAAISYLALSDFFKQRPRDLKSFVRLMPWRLCFGISAATFLTTFIGNVGSSWWVLLMVTVAAIVPALIFRVIGYPAETTWSLRSGVLILAYLMACASVIGFVNARLLDRYYVVDGSDLVVLRINGEHAICAPYDANAGAVEASFVIVDLAADPPPVLRSRRVGPLEAYLPCPGSQSCVPTTSHVKTQP